MTGKGCNLTIAELDAAIYGLNYTFGENGTKRHAVDHNTRVAALRKLEAFRASLVVAIDAART